MKLKISEKHSASEYEIKNRYKIVNKKLEMEKNSRKNTFFLMLFFA